MTAAAAPSRSAFSPALAAALIEFRKMFAPRRILVLLFLIAVAAAIALVTQFAGAAPSGGDPVSQAWPELYLTTAFLRAVVPLICLYIGTALWGEELESGTLVYIVTRPVSRPQVLLAKYAAAWFFLTAMLVPAVGIVGGVLCGLRDHGFGGVVAVLVLLPLANAVWLAVFVLIGTLMRRSLIGGIAVGGALELIIASMRTVARVISPGYHLGSAASAFDAFAGVPIDELVAGEPMGGVGAWCTLLCITAGALALACVRVRYREYSATRTD
ncbi:MAG: ABC transporter permease [Planctomycetota bacterium]|jgi:ABC-2 type transport system permease protein